MKVKTQCGACGGTGVYAGFAEPPGVAVVCLQCNGTGCHEVEYVPFTERKRRSGITTVRLSRGSFILNCGPGGSTITYNEFLNGKMPQSK